MAEEIQEAVQIIRVAYEGIEIAMRIGSGGLNAAQKAIQALIGMLEYEKTMGKTSMKKLLMKGGDLQVFQYKTEEAKKVEKLLKKYGILYSVLPDINKNNGMSEIIFHAEAVPRMNMIAKKLTHGKIGSFDEYVKDGDEKELDKLLKFLKGQKEGNVLAHTEEAELANEVIEGLIQKVGLFASEKKELSVEDIRENFQIGHVEAEEIIDKLRTLGLIDTPNERGLYTVLMDREGFEKRIKSYQELFGRIQSVAQNQNQNLLDITINKSLVVEENDRAIKTKVPGTWGEQVLYLWINKENTMEIHDGKTILTFLDPEKDFKLYDEENRVAEVKRGETLYENHYDKVEAEVRKRYEKSQRMGKGSQKKAPKQSNKRR